MNPKMIISAGAPKAVGLAAGEFAKSSQRTADEYRRVLTAASQIGAKAFAFQTR